MSASLPRRVHEPYVFAALAIALTAGFGLATILVAALALHWSPGTWWIATVQAHGHAQLFGWAGLFVLGVGLFFLPRLRGTVLAHVSLAPWALGAFVVGITLRAICQPLLGLLGAQETLQSLWGAVGRSGLALSGIAELLGAALVIFMLIASFRRAAPVTPAAPILPVRPYLALAGVSFVSASILNAALGIVTALRGGFLYESSLDDILTHLLIVGFILPITFALSVRNLPLFMRLAFPPKRALPVIVASYITGLFLRLIGYGIEQTFSALVGGLGMLIEGAAILAFIWAFDVLLRRKQPWTVSRTPPPPGYIETRRPTRERYPDYGEYGRFELLILSAYAWLAFAAIAEIVNGAVMLLGSPALLNPDVERHSITLGFITLLIFGMAVRMLPGFSGKRKVANTRLVLATFWLGNVATVFRVAPLLAPGLPGADIALGSSGAIGWLAVLCLAANLWMTFRSGAK